MSDARWEVDVQHRNGDESSVSHAEKYEYFSTGEGVVLRVEKKGGAFIRDFPLDGINSVIIRERKASTAPRYTRDGTYILTDAGSTIVGTCINDHNAECILKHLNREA